MLNFRKRGRGVRRVPGQMNGMERDYAVLLEARKHAGEIAEYHFEAIKLKLADKCYYSPDFLVMLANGELELHEVKGFMEDDAAVKIKTAAAMYPFRVMLVTRKKKRDPFTIREV